SAVRERELVLVARLKPDISDRSFDLRAVGLDTEWVRRLEGPGKRGLGEDHGPAVADPRQPSLVRPHEEHGVIAAQALHPDADAGMVREVNGQRRLDAIVAPAPKPMDDHALPAVLRNTKGQRRRGREIADAIDPGPAPEIAWGRRPSQADIGRAVDAQPVERERAV